VAVQAGEGPGKLRLGQLEQRLVVRNRDVVQVGVEPDDLVAPDIVYAQDMAQVILVARLPPGSRIHIGAPLLILRARPSGDGAHRHAVVAVVEPQLVDLIVALIHRTFDFLTVSVFAKGRPAYTPGCGQHCF